jgi:hypothetical protein
MKKVILVASLIFAFFLGACSVTSVSAEQTRPLKIWMQNENGSYQTLCVVDEDTGVNYVVVGRGQTGVHEWSVAITPRLNADGSLYVTN